MSYYRPITIDIDQAFAMIQRRHTAIRQRRRGLQYLCLAVLSPLYLFSATLSVQSHGATGDGRIDDTAAIQSTVDASEPGDTILFPKGTYRLSAPIKLQSNRIYQGQDNPVLLGANGSHTFTTPWDATSNITITGLIFDGAGLALRGARMPADNIQISGCTFQNISSDSGNWTTQIGIFISTGLRDSSITNSTFYNILTGGQAGPKDTAASAITGYNLKNVTISGNTFNTVNQAVSLEFDNKDTYSGVVISDNTGTQIHRMGIEMQGSNTLGLQVTGNTFANFLNPFWSTFGLSIVVDGGTGTLIQNNTVIQQPAFNGQKGGIGIEAGGKNTTVMNNNVQGAWIVGLAIGSAPDAIVAGNSLCGSGGTAQISFEAGQSAAPRAALQNNTLAAVCQ